MKRRAEIPAREMTTPRLVQLQDRINIYFVRRRDRGLDISIIYRNLKAVEAELDRRRVIW
jgi:hypothetical protein